MATAMAFETAVGPYQGELRAYCRKLTDNRWDAEDLYQDVLLRVLQYYRVSDDLRAVRPLLYKVARNLRIDQYRRKRGSLVAIDNAEGIAVETDDYAAVRELVEWTAEHLTRREMSMLFLAEVFRYTYNDIAEELHCTASAVRMVLHRAKKALRAGGKRRFIAGMEAGAEPEVDFWTHALMSREPGRLTVPV